MLRVFCRRVWRRRTSHRRGTLVSSAVQWGYTADGIDGEGWREGEKEDLCTAWICGRPVGQVIERASHSAVCVAWRGPPPAARCATVAGMSIDRITHGGRQAGRHAYTFLLLQFLPRFTLTVRLFLPAVTLLAAASIYFNPFRSFSEASFDLVWLQRPLLSGWSRVTESNTGKYR